MPSEGIWKLSNALEKAWEKIDLSLTFKELLKYTQKDGGKEFFWTPLPLTADSLMQLLDEKSLNDSLETKCPPKHKGMGCFFFQVLITCFQILNFLFSLILNNKMILCC